MDNGFLAKWQAERERRAFLALADGAVFRGVAFGARRDRLGEAVFNTGMCGYQEILTDPSYAGQLVTLTASEIGNYGINGEETYRFMGKSVETVEEDLIKDFDSASEGDVIAIFGRLSDYMVNSNMQITAAKWRDEDNNVIKNKLLMYADGKVADPYGFIMVKKGAEA